MFKSKFFRSFGSTTTLYLPRPGAHAAIFFYNFVEFYSLFHVNPTHLILFQERGGLPRCVLIGRLATLPGLSLWGCFAVAWWRPSLTSTQPIRARHCPTLTTAVSCACSITRWSAHPTFGAATPPSRFARTATATRKTSSVRSSAATSMTLVRVPARSRARPLSSRIPAQCEIDYADQIQFSKEFTFCYEDPPASNWEWGGSWVRFQLPVRRIHCRQVQKCKLYWCCV